MMNMIRNLLAGKASKPSQTQPLPKGLKAAPPIKNKKLLDLLTGQDITTSGGTHSTVNGQPALGSHAVR